MDTDMTVRVKGPKSDPTVGARIALDGIEAGEFEILVYEVSRSVRSGLAAALYASLEGSSSQRRVCRIGSEITQMNDRSNTEKGTERV
jgi:hypothetical protein